MGWFSRLRDGINTAIKRNEQDSKKITSVFTRVPKAYAKLLHNQRRINKKLYSNLFKKDKSGIKLKSKKTSLFKYMIPSKRREEVLGDLAEIKQNMIKEKRSKWTIKFVIGFHLMVIVFSAMIRTRLSDYGTSQKTVDKD